MYREEVLAMLQEDDELLPIVTKPNHWDDESKYQLNARERSKKFQLSDVDRRRSLGPVSWPEPEILHRRLHDGAERREALKALVKQSPIPIALKRAVKIPNKFELRIVPLG